MNAVSLPSPPFALGRIAGRVHDIPVIRLVDAGVGFLPVTLVGATAFGLAELRTLALLVLVPAVIAAVALHAKSEGRAVRFGQVLLVGLTATLLYDCYRWAFIGLGLLGSDPIPHIGESLHLEPAWLFGYLWRYCGNGSGLALAFVALGFRGVRQGIAFGLFVCSGLLVVLVVSPYGTQMLFPLTPAAVVMAVGGHVIYGAVLGHMAQSAGVRSGKYAQ